MKTLKTNLIVGTVNAFFAGTNIVFFFLADSPLKWIYLGLAFLNGFAAVGNIRCVWRKLVITNIKK